MIAIHGTGARPHANVGSSSGSLPRLNLLLLLLLFLIPLPASAQTPVLVQATIRDPQGFSYAGAAINITLANPGPGSPIVTPCAQPTCYFQNPGHFYADANGHFQAYLIPNSHITCTTSSCTTSYTFHVDAAVAQVNGLSNTLGLGGQSFDLSGITVTTAADLSSNFDALAPSLTNICSSLWAAQHPGSFPSAICGGGSGCTLPGINTAVLSEHPVGTCYGSLHFTWDDGTSKQNLQAGLTNTFDSNIQLGFAFGSSNAVTGLTTAGAPIGAFVLGQSNTVKHVTTGFTVDGSVVAIGDGNTLNANTAVGDGNGNSNVLGDSNFLYSTYQLNVEGYDNTVGRSSSTGSIGEGFVGGWENTIGIVSGSNLTVNQFSVVGSQNELGNGSTDTSFIGAVIGSGNHAWDTGSGTTAFIYGFDNQAHDTPAADVSIFGASNTASNVIQPTGSLAADSVIVGHQNTMTNSGGAFVAGVGSSTQGCIVCGALGFGVAQGANGTLGVGMSASGELSVSSPFSGETGAPAYSTVLNVNLGGTPSLGSIVKGSGAGTVVTSATTDTDGFVGIATFVGGGRTLIAVAGDPVCVFDGATTAWDYVQNSTTTAGDCHDAGGTYPASGQVIGKVLSTNGAGGSFQVLLYSPSR